MIVKFRIRKVDEKPLNVTASDLATLQRSLEALEKSYNYLGEDAFSVFYASTSAIRDFIENARRATFDAYLSGEVVEAPKEAEAEDLLELAD